MKNLRRGFQSARIGLAGQKETVSLGRRGGQSRNTRKKDKRPVSGWLALKYRLADKLVLSKIRP